VSSGTVSSGSVVFGFVHSEGWEESTEARVFWCGDNFLGTKFVLQSIPEVSESDGCGFLWFDDFIREAGDFSNWSGSWAIDEFLESILRLLLIEGKDCRGQED